MSAIHSEIDCIAPPLIRAAALKIQVCRTWTELQGFYADWNRLLQTCSSASIFQTPEWLGPWWAVFGENQNKELLGLVFADPTGATVGIAPLYIDHQHFLGSSVKVLRLVGAGSGDSDALGFITAPGYEQLCAAAFLSWLAGHREWDACALETLPFDSSMAQHISDSVLDQHWQLYSESSPNFFISLPPVWSEYLERLDSSFRPLLTRYPRRLQSRYSVCIQRCEREEDLDASLQTLFTLHQMRWSGRGHPGAFSMPERCDFYFRMARSFLQRGWLEFWLLKLENEVVAAQFCFRYGNTVYLLQEGFNPQYTADKVGYALRAYVLEEIIRAGVTRYDFLGGADAYKVRFSAQQSSYLSLRFAGPSFRGRLLLAWQRRKQEIKKWLKSRLPAPVLARFRPQQASSAERPKEATD